ncbi:hypothetical protein J7E50_17930 [Pedobacter sp. ISL-68]|uniref:conjugal transfer protein MobA n=1 Tax=unclassified Pedobacter TaxID=2628915 RepID=UPI001BE755E2|nr:MULTISPECIES: conjugal transfer protein MobA [unclassified Pedobacter]MBT2559804.1 hypothetical protein [Pedobacter sp. ISL-64]MBT2592109.1 hypothetical protein [Pedobacter sp. ISL-68]
MEDNIQHKQKKGGRNPKKNPAIFRYSISLNAEENKHFLSLFKQSGMKVMAHFITACLFQKTIKTVKIDSSAHDYHIRLTNFYGQFRSVGVNYNQVIKIMYRNFSEKKASAYLFKLEKQTLEMAKLIQEVIQLTQEFETKHLKKEK